MDESERSWGWAESSVLVGASGLYSMFIARSAFWVDGHLTFSLVDDAMISMRYAANLAHGHGLVWNETGDRVEGFTNFLWTIWMAVLHLTGLPPDLVSLAVMVSGAICLLITAIVARSIARLMGADRRLGLLVLALVAFSYPLIYWTLRGMEVGALSLAVALLVLACFHIADAPDQSRWIAAAALAGPAALLTRQDSLPIVVVCLGWLLLHTGYRKVGGWLPVATSIAAFLAIELFRRLYYGAWVPNTYLLKLDGIGLADRLERGGQALLGTWINALWLPVALAVVALMVGRPRLLSRRSLLAAVVLVPTVYSVYVGGDAWEWYGFSNRYLAVMIPELSVLAAFGLSAVLAAPTRNVWVTVASASGLVLVLGVVLRGKASGPQQLAVVTVQPLAILVLASLVLLVCSARGNLSRLSGIAGSAALLVAVLALAVGRDAGAWIANGAVGQAHDQRNARLGIGLRSALPQDSTILVSSAGAIPYFAHLQSFDELGKSDAVIARLKPSGPFVPGHNKADLDYSVGTLQPDVVVELYRVPSDAMMAGWGYACIANYWVRRGAMLNAEEVAKIDQYLPNRRAGSCA